MFGHNARASTAYGRVAVESAVLGADKHQLIALLFNGVSTYIRQARAALGRGDTATKIDTSTRAIRLIDEGLKCSLDRSQGEIADSLYNLYEYCSRRLLQGHLKNDDAAYAEVDRLLGEIAEAWRAISPNAKAAMQKAA